MGWDRFAEVVVGLDLGDTRRPDCRRRLVSGQLTAHTFRRTIEPGMRTGWHGARAAEERPGGQVNPRERILTALSFEEPPAGRADFEMGFIFQMASIFPIS